MRYRKYSNKKVEVDGIKFDSKLEAKRYKELKAMEGRGEITELTLQPVFELQPSFRHNGKTHRKITYIADFSYFLKDSDKLVVEDVKGFKTDIYKLKMKLFLYRYPDVDFIEITK